jgi:methyl-accepting chemotaxis protein
MNAVAYTSALRKTLVRFVAAMALLSILGGYLLSHLVLRMNDISAQRSVQMLEIEEYLDDAVITLGQQVQEWKNMLLRSDSKELYARHREAFKESSVGVQYALRNAKRSMQEVGMDTSEVDSLVNEHRSMLTRYLQAFSRLDPQSADSINEVDRYIMGVDRKLQIRITTVKDATSKFAKQQLSGTSYAEQHRNMMFGILGAVCLFLMSLLGLVLGYRLMRVND